MQPHIVISRYVSDDLVIENFEVMPQEAWCLYGDNDSEIHQIISIFTAPGINSGSLPAVVCFDSMQQIFEDELAKDDTDFLDQIDPGTRARTFLDQLTDVSSYITALNFEHCLDKGFRQLSSGESRKLLLLSAISRSPGIVILENPFDGLDVPSCIELDRMLKTLHLNGVSLILLVSNPGDIPPWCSNFGWLKEKRLLLFNSAKAIIQALGRNIQKPSASFELALETQPPDTGRQTLVSLKNGVARYGDNVIFSALDLTIETCQHTLITGPNGSGKSTLLQIITGDNQNCYGNTLELFNIKRGSGESIWELKRLMGIVSPDLHRNHYIPGSALQVVLSGFFDSIGVYQRVNTKQKKLALEWINRLGMSGCAQQPFRSLSYGRQRLCLIARALIKMPPLLILDEPTHGLDQTNRSQLLDVLEKIAEEKLSTILYASHRTDEFRSFFVQHIDMAHHGPQSS